MPATKKYKAEFAVRTTNFKANKLLNRKQFVVEVSHPTWNGTVPKSAVVKKLAALYKVPDENQVSVFNMKTAFGGGKTTAFGLIYDDVASAKRLEPNYRLVRRGLAENNRKTARKSQKEKKNRNHKIRGAAKGKAQKKGKK
jgi:small subunit ribosomal protein S24e